MNRRFALLGCLLCCECLASRRWLCWRPVPSRPRRSSAAIPVCRRDARPLVLSLPWPDPVGPSSVPPPLAATAPLALGCGRRRVPVWGRTTAVRSTITPPRLPAWDRTLVVRSIGPDGAEARACGGRRQPGWLRRWPQLLVGCSSSSRSPASSSTATPRLSALLSLLPASAPATT